MSEVIAQVSLAGLVARPKPIEDSVYVGKDVLDLLTGSMYLDPLNIYREYVQNAADSIDEARDAGLPFPAGPQIAFEFNHQERSVRIRDCGAAIPAGDFVRRLTTIGASGKRGKKQRGFRGVGRLSGLGYCQELIFRSRAQGEPKVSELRWDGRVLRDKMRDPAFIGGLADIVAAAASQTRLPGDGFPERFFEVELRKVQRLRNDLLLNEAAIKDYLSQVAPVPFAPSFSHAEEIDAHLARAGVGRTVDIQFAGDPIPVLHRAVDEFPISDKVNDKITVIEPVEYFDSDGDLVATGWLGHHSYAGAISRRLGLGGVRLRCGNIQIGDERILSQLFPEPRFSAWAIGDIHVISPKIIPNGRRDEFEPSVHYAHLQNELTLTMKGIAQRIRSSRSSETAQNEFRWRLRLWTIGLRSRKTRSCTSRCYPSSLPSQRTASSQLSKKFRNWTMIPKGAQQLMQGWQASGSRWQRSAASFLTPLFLRARRAKWRFNCRPR